MSNITPFQASEILNSCDANCAYNDNWQICLENSQILKKHKGVIMYNVKSKMKKIRSAGRN